MTTRLHSLTPLPIPTPVFSFSHLDRHYFIVRTPEFSWRKALGYKPRQPYVILDQWGYAFNGVSEADLVWYRSRGTVV